MRQTRHKFCKCCRRVRIKMSISKTGICTSCKAHKDPEYFIKENGLPIWYEDGDMKNKPNFYVPSELKNMTIAEKLLIQRISPFVPMQHIKNGIFGLRGHVCAFEQDINGFIERLPLDKDDVEMIRVQQTIRQEIGSDTFMTKSFLVRRSKVLGALRWLKKNSRAHHDIEIDERRLDWIGESDAAYMTPKTVDVDDMKVNGDETVETDDVGPNPVDGMIARPHGDEVVATGYVDNGGASSLSPDDELINSELQNAVAASDKKKEIEMKWPSISQKPVNEFGDTKIFACAFPWLFPGGLGDPKDFPGTLGQWGSMMLFYEDGRFVTDKIFCFFALNYIVRQRNASSGRFFIDNYPSGCPETLDELKKKIEDGDTRFINSLSFFGKRVHGSNSYWIHKRSEVYTWINHHVEVGNGAPVFFITLSCAEYFWADVSELLKDRLKLAGLDPSLGDHKHPKFLQTVNDFAVVIQEYFQERVVTWLDTVGKAVFGIKHYWIRYEFAPGRGQIHAHLLAIPEDQSVYQAAHALYRQENGEEERAKLFSNWARTKFNLTAETDPDFDSLDQEEIAPCNIRFMDLAENDLAYKRDAEELLRTTQMHTCSKFCMKPGKRKEYVICLICELVYIEF